MDSRPFVKPFKTIGNYYIYDVNTDTVLATTKESYEFLKSARDISEAAGQVKKELATLQEKGFLSSHTVMELKTMKISLTSSKKIVPVVSLMIS